MFTVVETEAFSKWLANLRDRAGAAVIARRARRISQGAFGDAKSVGDSVSELRIDYGPGYRVYFTRRGAEVVILLCGGDKSTQARDIAKAQQLAQEV
ncbi:MAG TPA: type II toxin-antitoxin system RelE/ParE family toxin [Phenylobacterium sp.]